MTVDDLLISNTDEVSGGQSVKFGIRICEFGQDSAGPYTVISSALDLTLCTCEIKIMLIPARKSIHND